MDSVQLNKVQTWLLAASLGILEDDGSLLWLHWHLLVGPGAPSLELCAWRRASRELVSLDMGKIWSPRAWPAAWDRGRGECKRPPRQEGSLTLLVRKGSLSVTIEWRP